MTKVKEEPVRGLKSATMNTDVDALTMDMIQFAGLLRIIGQTKLADNYEIAALKLRQDESDQHLEKVRDWVRQTMRGGSGTLSDFYVRHDDGSVADELNAKYESLLQNLTDFANNCESPESDLLKQMGGNMFANGYTYLRKIEAPIRKGLLMRGRILYEVMTAPGVTTVVEAKLLDGVVGNESNGSRRDMQECRMQAHKLYSEGRSDEWVHFSSSQIVPGELLRNANQK